MNTGVGCRFLLQGIFLIQGWNQGSLVSSALASRFFTTSAAWEAPVCIYIPVYLCRFLLMDIENASDRNSHIGHSQSTLLWIYLHIHVFSYIHMRVSLYALGKKLLSHRINVKQFNITIIIMPCLFFSILFLYVSVFHPGWILSYLPSN